MPDMKSKERNSNLRFGAFQQVFATSKCLAMVSLNQSFYKLETANKSNRKSALPKPALTYRRNHKVSTGSNKAAKKLVILIEIITWLQPPTIDS